MKWDHLTDYLDTLIADGLPCCDLKICKDHEVIFRHMAGCREMEHQTPLSGKELYWLFSCTKVITTCAAMQLMESGKLHPDDPVSMYLPEYAHLTVRDGDVIRPASRVMTVRHLMSMQSGLDYDLAKPAVRRVIEGAGRPATTREIVKALAEEPLCFEPGTDFLYSLSHDVLAAVIEAVSGQRFSEYLMQNIFAPLDLQDFSFSLTPENVKRLADIYQMEGNTLVRCQMDSNNYRLTDAYESGGAGLMGSVDDYATFLDAIACGGTGKNGAHILAPEMIQLWSANQLTAQSRRSFDQWKRLGYSYALGVRTRVDLSVGGAGAIGEFGWDGAACSYAMIDPSHRLSAFFATHVRNFGYAYDVIHPTVRRLIYECLAE